MFNIQPQIGIDEILDALVHQRIISMTAELVTLRAMASSLDWDWDEVRCEISDLLAAEPPSEVAGIASDHEMLKVWFSWNESRPCEDGLCDLTMILCARYSTEKAIRGEISIALKRRAFAPTCVPEELIARFDTLKAATKTARAKADAMASCLRSSTLKTDLRGSLLSRVIEEQAPEISKVIKAIAAERPKLLGVDNA